MSSARPPFSFVVGIAGGTGSGKTTVASRMVESLPPGASVLIEHDGYYRDRSAMSPAERASINYDHPDAMETELLVAHLDELRAGRTVQVPQYDFRQHVRKPEARSVPAAPVIVVEGILVLADERLRARMDLRVFVDTDADIRLMRRIARDMEERGRTFPQISEQYYRSVRPMHLEFVEPSKRWADVIVPEGGANRVALEMVIARLEQLLVGDE